MVEIILELFQLEKLLFVVINYGLLFLLILIFELFFLIFMIKLNLCLFVFKIHFHLKYLIVQRFDFRRQIWRAYMLVLLAQNGSVNTSVSCQVALRNVFDHLESGSSVRDHQNVEGVTAMNFVLLLDQGF